MPFISRAELKWGQLILCKHWPLQSYTTPPAVDMGKWQWCHKGDKPVLSEAGKHCSHLTLCHHHVEDFDLLKANLIISCGLKWSIISQHCFSARPTFHQLWCWSCITGKEECENSPQTVCGKEKFGSFMWNFSTHLSLPPPPKKIWHSLILYLTLNMNSACQKSILSTNYETAFSFNNKNFLLALESRHFIYILVHVSVCWCTYQKITLVAKILKNTWKIFV